MWRQTSSNSFSRVQFYLTSLGGQLRQSMDEKDKGWVNWKVSSHTSNRGLELYNVMSDFQFKFMKRWRHL